MLIKLILSVLVLGAAGAEARTRAPPIRNPALLNIGFVCRWDNACTKRQQRAMNSALAYVAKVRPPAWKVQVCNRNSARNGTRKDWIGFNNCIRNPAVRPAPVRKRNRR